MVHFEVATLVMVMNFLSYLTAKCRLRETETHPETVNPSLRKNVEILRHLAEKIGLDAAVTSAADFVDGLDHTDPNTLTRGFVAERVEDILRRAEDQLGKRLFLFMPNEKACYWLDEQPFGEEVANGFSKLAYDIGEAAKCFAAGRWTATVFHLMRVMEHGLQRLVQQLRIEECNLNRPWGIILSDIGKAINALPGARSPSHPNPPTPEERSTYERFAETAAYLKHVKDTWRDTTMHTTKTYNEEEAEKVFRNVRDFTQSLVRA
jgi:hypothetical protein